MTQKRPWAQIDIMNSQSEDKRSIDELRGKVAMGNEWSLSGAGPETYEEFQVPAIFEPLARVLLDHIGLKAGQNVLDVACGTGVVARKAVAIVGNSGRVVGVDFNRAMLEVASKKTPSGISNIEWQQADAGDLPSLDATFDVAICQQGLQFFSDKVGKLREMHRVLKRDGRVWLAVWQSPEHSPVNQASNQVLGRHLGPEAAKVSRAPFSLGDSEELRSLMSAAEFRDIEIQASTITRHMAPPQISIPAQLTSIPIGPQIAALEEDKRSTIVDEISEKLSQYLTDEGMSVPQGTHIVSARK
jgi:ubiquinone/menaquinone biosynthesis C-methylase UbiE